MLDEKSLLCGDNEHLLLECDFEAYTPTPQSSEVAPLISLVARKNGGLEKR